VDRVKGRLSEQVVVTLRLCRECSIAEIMKVHSDKLQRCLHAEKKYLVLFTSCDCTQLTL